MSRRSDIIVGLDLGTSKICAVVGQLTATGGMDIIGVGQHPCKGLRKGVVINIDATVAAIRHALHDAAQMSGCDITHVYAGIAGGHIRGVNAQGSVAIKEAEVSQADVSAVIESARNMVLPEDREIIHILPQDFVVDQQDGIREPIGISGARLDARVHIVTGSMTSVQNVIKCAHKAGVAVADVVLEPLAASEAVLSADEKALGVALIDIGGGTTDLAIWRDGMVAHTSVLALGGDHLSQDIAIGLRTPNQNAERIKHAHGAASMQFVRACGDNAGAKELSDAESFEVTGVGGRAPRQVARRTLIEIIEPRLEEIFNLVRQDIRQTGFAEVLSSGAVITGGTTLLAGMPELAESILKLPVRRGAPEGVGGLAHIVANPMYATGVGLVQYGRALEHRRQSLVQQKNRFASICVRIRSWFGEIF